MASSVPIIALYAERRLFVRSLAPHTKAARNAISAMSSEQAMDGGQIAFVSWDFNYKKVAY